MNDYVIDRLATYVASELSWVQQQFLINTKNNGYQAQPRDGVTSPTLAALHRQGLINRDGWKAEITWMGTLVALRLEARQR